MGRNSPTILGIQNAGSKILRSSFALSVHIIPLEPELYIVYPTMTKQSN